MKIFTKQEALDYHSNGRKGKIEVIPTKAFQSQKDLSLAYSPGVAEPCLEIEKNDKLAYDYTAKGNLIGVISNGTAVLGLGNIGAQAAKPVMEGKGFLFKIFADIDVFDLEINENNPQKLIEIIKTLEPSFGGINLEDIKAPECFVIEERLKSEMNIPVFHDDQHGTAIISGAGLLNALKLVNKKIEDVKVVFNGAGAAGIACARFFVSLGVAKENIVLCDSKGVVRQDNFGDNIYKKEFATNRNINTLAEAMNGADVFAGVSVGNVVSKEMIKSMSENPIVFAMANPDPEISYDDAIKARPDLIMATGRSDFPNQVNNVLGFPFIFRGALDVQASCINEEMKKAAAKSLAELALLPVPDYVSKAYGQEKIEFGKEYIIPKPLDLRVIEYVAVAVAKAAIETKVANKIIKDWETYKIELRKRVERVHNNYYKFNS
ncbi:MAG: malate dehydrogenase [Bacteroidales bacterium]|jgi:malate dehydrogenase (oxaloacetate-decarboxylating)(NADP+)|nr:malate dehydrogenase [Bacteroidales bacterium]